ncbi:MAG TPA: AI-2E family transporter [Terriglobales bacterium]|nr:AI-2E family transporter [Terriglobales bacterium]
MDFREHFQTTGGALKNWFIAQLQDAAAVALLWLLGLIILHVPLWFVWAPLAFVLQFIPHFGPVLTMVGPVLAALLSGGWERMLYVLILYAVVVVVDGLLFQPYIMRRTAKVPVWASVLVPLVMAFTLGFWGVLLAPPLLAVYFAYRNRSKTAVAPPNSQASAPNPQHRGML